MTTRARADLREGGRWGLLQRWKNDALYVLVRGALFVTTRLPRGFLRLLGRALGALAYALWPEGRRTALANLGRVFPDEVDRARIARASFRHLGEHVADAVASLAPDAGAMPLPFPPEERCILQHAVDEGRGVLFVSAHLGPWERVARTMVAAGFELTTVARESYDPRLTTLYDRLRGAHGIRSVYRGERGAGLRMLRTLRRGGILGMVMDLRSRVPSIEAPFLGVPAPTARGPAQLALATGAAVVVGTVARCPAGHLYLSMTRLREESDVLACTRAMNHELSRRIVALREHWLWMHPRF